MSNNDYDFLFKILLIGDSGVGKSSVLLRFTDNEFTESFIATIGVDFKIKTLTIDNKVVKLQIWDTAGQERFRTIVNSYYRGSHGVIIVYDISDRQSFNNVKYWLAEVEKYAAGTVSRILVGNKCDLTLKRNVTYEEGKQLAESLDMPFIETSAKTSAKISSVFETLAELIKSRLRPIKGDERDPFITPRANPQNTNGSWCYC